MIDGFLDRLASDPVLAIVLLLGFSPESVELLVDEIAVIGTPKIAPSAGLDVHDIKRGGSPLSVLDLVQVVSERLIALDELVGCPGRSRAGIDRPLPGPGTDLPIPLVARLLQLDVGLFLHLLDAPQAQVGDVLEPPEPETSAVLLQTACFL